LSERVDDLSGRIGKMDEKFEKKFDVIDTKLDKMMERMDTKFDAQNALNLRMLSLLEANQQNNSLRKTQ